MDAVERERELVRDYFGRTRPGFFVEVGANDPHFQSQTWHLEELGWTGVLVEPLPDLAAQLRQTRHAKVFAFACSSPSNAGHRMPLYVAGALSSLDRAGMAFDAEPQAMIEVPIRTLDDILTESKAPEPIDFLSIDVEGHELEVLHGFSFARWRPRLLLLEDHVGSLRKHRFVTAAGYRLVRRTGLNGWYVPADAPGTAIGWGERWKLMRKYYLALPVRRLRNLTRRLRSAAKNRRQAR